MPAPQNTDETLHTDFRWPDNKRVAITVNVALEVWSDPNSTTQHGVRPIPENFQSRTNWRAKTIVEYGFNVGIYRILDALDHLDIKATAIVGGLAAERYPELTKYIANRGHEICAHSYDQGVWVPSMSHEEEEKTIFSSTSLLEKISGVRPLGWICPHAQPSDRTIPLLAKAGYLWNGDLQDKELPYSISTEFGNITEVPYILTLNDLLLYGYVMGSSLSSPTHAFEHMKDEFDALYSESSEQPRRMVIGTHPYVTGRAGRAKTLGRFLEYASQHEGVWFPRSVDIAKWFLNAGSHR